MNHPDLPDLTPELLGALEHRYELAPLTRLASPGIVNRVYANEDVVLRVPNPDTPDWFEDSYTEAVAVPAVTKAGILTPELRVFDDSRELIDAPVTLYDRAPGLSLYAHGWEADDPRAQRTYRALGAELARLHLRVTGVPDPQGWLDTPERDDLQAEVEALAVDGYLSGSEANWAARVLERARAVVLPPPRFLHNDLHAGNILALEDGTLSALIDWGDAGWGEPTLEFASLPPRSFPALLAGYREVAPELLGESPEALILTDALMHALERLRRPPTAFDLWNSRPGSSLVELLRFALDAGPQWSGWLRP